MLWAIVFGVSLAIGAVVLHRLNVPPVVRYLIPAVPLLAGLLYMRTMVTDIHHQMDELQLRISLEAAAVVVCGLFIIMCVYPQLEAAHLVGPLDYSTVLVLIGVLGLVGYLRAVWRYR